MEPIRVSPLEGIFNFLGALASGVTGPKEQITERLEDIIVDTSLPSDTYIWETGVKRKNIEGEWVIVEQYPDKNHAQEKNYHAAFFGSEPEHYASFHYNRRKKALNLTKKLLLKKGHPFS